MPTTAPPTVAPQQALLPEALIVFTILDHPAIRAAWSTLVAPLLESIAAKVSALQPGSRLLIGAVVYRPAPVADLDSLLRYRSTLAKLPFVTGSKFLSHAAKNPRWLDWIASSSSSPSPSSRNAQWDWLDSPLEASQDELGFSDNNQGDLAKAPALEALVGALELFEIRDTERSSRLPGFALLAPQRSNVVSRHLLHVSTSDALLPLDISTTSIFNQSASNDDATAADICSRLAQRGVSITSCGLKGSQTKDLAAAASSPGYVPALQPSNGIEKLHRLVADAGSLSDDNISQLLPAPLKDQIQSETFLVVSGVAVAPASASKKRGRGEEAEEGFSLSTPDGPSAVKRTKSGSISKVEPGQPSFQFPQGINTASLSAQAAALQQKIPKLHPSVSTKIIFLKQQQEVMFRNLSLIAAQLLKAEKEGMVKNPGPGMNRPYLEQLRNQLISQQQGLRTLIQMVVTGAEQNPNFNVCLQSLVNIDKEAREMGVILGGPSSGQPDVARPARSGSVTSNDSSTTSQPVTLPGAARPPVTDVNAGAGVGNSGRPAAQPAGGQNAQAAVAGTAASAQSNPARSRPFWRGPITWSVISDPTTRTKREISTFVSATSNANAFEKLMLPWPDRLQITAISQLTPRNLQIYAQSQGAPYVLFASEAPSTASGGEGAAAVPPERNSTMYASLAGSLDAKKSCAFIRHGSSAGSGLILFATTQPTSSAERNVAPGSVPPKLIGVLFKDPVPFARLLAAQAAQQQQQQPQQQQPQQAPPTQPPPPPLQQQQQPQPPPQQQQQQPQPQPQLQPQPQAQIPLSTMPVPAPAVGGGVPVPTDLASLAQLLGLGTQGAAAAGLMSGDLTTDGTQMDQGQQQQHQQQQQQTLQPVTIEQLRALGLLQ